MEGRRRRRSRSRTARPECCHAGGRSSYGGVPTGLTNIHDLTDDLLELILLRVPCRVTLACAAATCRPWRRLISGADFIRRFRSLHPPLVLGHYYSGRSTSFVPAVPSPPAPGDAASAVDRVISGRVSSRLDLDFLPRDYDTRSMVLTDCRGGLLAFVRYDSSVVVCDPLARRFREVLLPPTPPASSERFSPCLGAFLLDADADAGAGAGAGDTVVVVPSLSVSNFKVLCVPVVSNDDDDRLLTARAFVFSARDSRWLLLNSTALQPYTYRYSGNVEPYYSVFVGRMDGSLVWSVRSGKVIHLDESTGKFSIYALLPAGSPVDDNDAYYRDEYIYKRWNLRVVGRDDDGTGGVRLARIVDSDLEVLRCVPGSGGGAVVTVERAVNLSHLTNMEARPGRSSWRFLEMDEAVAAGCVVVSTGKQECTWMFTVDVDTMELERVQKSLRNWDSRPAFPYEFPWPPPIKM